MFTYPWSLRKIRQFYLCSFYTENQNFPHFKLQLQFFVSKIKKNPQYNEFRLISYFGQKTLNITVDFYNFYLNILGNFLENFLTYIILQCYTSEFTNFKLTRRKVFLRCTNLYKLEGVLDIYFHSLEAQIIYNV